MGQVLAFRNGMLIKPVTTPVAERRLSAKRLSAAGNKALLLELVHARMLEGMKARPACEWVHANLLAERLPRVYLDASRAEAKRGGCHVSLSSLMRWLEVEAKHGTKALAGDYRGRQRKAQPWDVIATEYLQLPTYMDCGAIAFNLEVLHGFKGVTAAQVRSLAATLPSNMAETSPRKLGRHHYNQNVRPFRLIDRDSVPPGVEWEIDGHRCDFYVAHPVTGKHYRPELTVIVDKGSGFYLAWTFADHENAFNTLYAVSLAIRRHNHVPLFLHADPGSTRARMMSDEMTGFLARMSIQVRFAIAGNARGKGLIEGSFNLFEQRCGKLISTTYCGHCRTDDDLKRLEYKIEKGAVRLPPQSAAVEAANVYFNAMNQRIARNRHQTREELWAQREQRPMAHPNDAIARPADRRKVNHHRITHQGRIYYAPELVQLERREVLFEYEMDDDSKIFVYDERGNFICIAELQLRAPGLSASRIADQAQKSLEGKRKRRQRKDDEDAARARGLITHEHTLQGLDDLGAAPDPSTLDEFPEPLDLTFHPEKEEAEEQPLLDLDPPRT